MSALALFPGQGSQTVGMGRHLWEVHTAAADAFEEASDVLGFDLLRLCADGPLEELTRTDNAQLAVFVTSVATWRVLTGGDGKGEALTAAQAAQSSSAAVAGEAAATTRAEPVSWLVLGHSLGDYSALVACGHLSFRDGLRVVARRGEAMLECASRNPGGMAAILGLSDEEVQTACDVVPDVWPANFNSPGQVVISGTLRALAECEAECMRRGAKKVVRLRVSGAFHSPLMAEAAHEIRRALAEVELRHSSGPRFFSATELVFPESADLGDVLVRQVTAPVRFAEAVRRLTAGDAAPALRGDGEGADGSGERPLFAVEVGPGKVLAGLFRKVARHLSVMETETEAGLNEAAVRYGGMHA
jgi:[acyl-carrier-protein] S-malonyltransferase